MPESITFKQFKKVTTFVTKKIDMKQNLLQSKLMIITSLRVSESLNAEILRVSGVSGLSKRDVIRLAIQKGLSAVEDFASEQPKESKNEQQIHSGPVCGQAGGTENEGRSGSVGRRDTL